MVSPNTPSITTLLSDLGPIAIGDSVHDSASISGATATAGGTVKYAVYGNLTDCNAGTYATPGGTSAGSVTVTNGTVPDSNSIQFNSAGTFYWRAFYSGDANNTGPVSSTCTSETLVVSPNTPSITTLLSDLGPIAIGDSVHDSASISGATATAGGTVKYAVYGNLTDCNAGTYATPGGTGAGCVTVTNGDRARLRTASTFNSAGTFYWRAFYSGDANNTGPASSTCTSETLVVSPNTPGLTTTPSEDTGSIGDTLTDSATLSGSTTGAGDTDRLLPLRPRRRLLRPRDRRLQLDRRADQRRRHLSQQRRHRVG